MKLYGSGQSETEERYGEDWVIVNRKLTEMARALIKARPRYYVDWLITAARVALQASTIFSMAC